MKSKIGYNESTLSARKGAIEESAVEPVPLIHFQTIKDYERLYKPAELARGVLTMDHESVLIRRPLWWTKDGEHIPDARPDMDLDQVCESHGWKVVTRFGDHFAVIAPEDGV